MIPITKPFLPPLSSYQSLVKGVFESGHLTNYGPLATQLEKEIAGLSKVPNVLLTGNGTIALQIALKAIKKRGKIITTPFSYVATSSSLVWEGYEPVFADIDPETFNLNPDSVIECMNDEIVGIVPTHCFGNACDIDAFEEISKQWEVPVIYDAAHCFGSKFKGESLFRFGTLSITSLHATKIFHSVEGGAIFSMDESIIESLSYMRNFGHFGPEGFVGLGINGKNSDFHAAMGLSILPFLDEILKVRKSQAGLYREKLSHLPVKFQAVTPYCESNHSYFPVIFESSDALTRVKESLEANGIYPRRYFYPSLNLLPYVQRKFEVPAAESISRRVLCLPLFHDLKSEEQGLICELVERNVES